jgi:hypothetical protein
LTDGVTGLLLRYYFQNNTNIWLWGLYGNDERRGWDFSASDGEVPEFGGRLQVPLGPGELAFSGHHRGIDRESPTAALLPLGESVDENRFALDGKWDIGVGVWFEAALVRQDSAALASNRQRALNLGLDYTFGWGNGLNLVLEHFILSYDRKEGGGGDDVRISALALNYPLGLLDSLNGIAYYDWEQGDFYSFLRWQRTSDRWGLHVMAFWNPDDFRLPQVSGESDLFTGRGVLIMGVFYF